MRLAACTLGLCALPLAANAHHSRVEFSDEVLELEGQLTELVWLNPHPALFLELENETGEPETWRVEGLYLDARYRDPLATQCRGLRERRWIRHRLLVTQPQLITLNNASTYSRSRNDSWNTSGLPFVFVTSKPSVKHR